MKRLVYKKIYNIFNIFKTRNTIDMDLDLDNLDSLKRDIVNNLNTPNKIMEIYNYIEWDPIIIKRGIDYYYDNRIKNFNKNNNTYTCVVSGSEDYDVSITFKSDGYSIDKMSCTCPYFNEYNTCKHTYALLYKIKYGEEYVNIKIAIQQVINSKKNLLNKITNYIEKRIDRYSLKLIISFDKLNNEYNIFLNKLQSLINAKNFNTELLNDINDILNKLDNILKDIINNERNINEGL